MNNLRIFTHCIHPSRLSAISHLPTLRVLDSIPNHIARTFTSNTGLISNSHSDSSDTQSSKRKARRSKKHKEKDIIPPEYLTELRSRLSPLPGPDPDPITTLTSSIESYQPNKQILHEFELQELREQLSFAFNVKQLKDYLKGKGIAVGQPRKAWTVEKVIRDVWKLESREKREEELNREREKQKMGEKIIVPSRRCELFFLVGQDGGVLRSVEKQTKTKIFIDTEGETYTISGKKQEDIDNAQDKLSSIVSSLQEEWIEVPWKQETLSDDKTDLIDKEKITMVNDIVAYTGTYIGLDGDKLHIVSNNQTAHGDALRLIITYFNGLGILQTAPRKPPDLHASDISYTAVHSGSDRGETEYAFIPMYDSGAMHMVEKNVGLMGGWARVGKIVKATEERKEIKLDSEESVMMLNENWSPMYENLSFENLKKELEDEKFLGQLSEKSELSLEARFGNILFNEPTRRSASPTLFRLPIVNTFDRAALNAWWTSGVGKQIFFPKHPPRPFLEKITSIASTPFIQRADTLEQNGRVMVVEYLNNAFIPWSPLPTPPFNKDEMNPLTPRGVVFTFDLADIGKLTPLSMRAIYSRRTFDILTLNLPVDFRFTAQVEVPLLGSSEDNAEENTLRTWLKEFKVRGYADVQCPPIKTARLLSQTDEVTYVLTSVRFERRAGYVIGDSEDVFQVRSVEEHESLMRRGEVVFAPVPQPFNLMPVKEMWDRFLKGSLDVVNAWN